MRGLLGLLVTAALTGAASAATITDATGAADYAITSVQLFSKGTGGTNDPSGKSYAGVQVNVSYGADTLVPFNSQGGYAAVTSAGRAFDITLQLSSFDDDPNNNWDQLFVTLNVLNDTPFAWSDFHVEFYDATFTNKLGLTLLQVGTGTATYPYFSNVVFDQSSTYGQYGGAELHFWSSTTTQGVAASNQISFRWDWGNPGDLYAIGDTIGVRLIATVPEPGTSALLGAGIGGLGWLAARSRRKSARPAR
jgi:PEP-CTERM motif